jgi:5'-nucleotidase/UDP-sugar diphosphatase
MNPSLFGVTCAAVPRRAGAALALGAALLSCCATAPDQALPVRITILHTDDHHGRFWANHAGEYGLTARRTLIDQVRADVPREGGYTLLLDAGDVNTGTPESDMLEAEPDFRGMSLLRYDAMAVGNHKFDRSAVSMRRQRYQWSSFPWLSANVSEHGAPMFDAYRVCRLGGVRVAVFGPTADETSKLLSHKHCPDVSVSSPLETASALVPQLRRDNDIVIALTHMGRYPDGRHGVNAPGDVELARGVEGIDLIAGGHSQNPLCLLAANVRDEQHVPGAACVQDVQNGAWIVQAFEMGK